MFYFVDGAWTPFKNKFTYTVVEETYGDMDTIEGVENLTVEPIVLTPEEHSRLESVRYVENIGQKELIKFVKEGILPGDGTIFVEFETARETEEQRKALKELVDVNAVPGETLMKMKILIKQYDPKAYYEKDDLVEDNGALYVVIQDHLAQEDWRPIDTPALYALKLTSLDGTPQPWVKPDSTNPYMKGDKVIFEGKIYESLIDNNIWSPAEHPQGWYTEPVLEEWSSAKLYKIGEQVLFEGKTYESVIDNNSWSPADYAAGWKEIPAP